MSVHRIPDDVVGRPLWTPEHIRARMAHLDRVALVHRVIAARATSPHVCPPIPAVACEGTATPPPTPFAAAAPRPGDHPNCRCVMIPIRPFRRSSMRLRLRSYLRRHAVDILGVLSLLVIGAIVASVAAYSFGDLL